MFILFHINLYVKHRIKKYMLCFNMLILYILYMLTLYIHSNYIYTLYTYDYVIYALYPYAKYSQLPNPYISCILYMLMFSFQILCVLTFYNLYKLMFYFLNMIILTYISYILYILMFSFHILYMIMFYNLFKLMFYYPNMIMHYIIYVYRSYICNNYIYTLYTYSCAIYTVYAYAKYSQQLKSYITRIPYMLMLTFFILYKLYLFHMIMAHIICIPNFYILYMLMLYIIYTIMLYISNSSYIRHTLLNSDE